MKFAIAVLFLLMMLLGVAEATEVPAVDGPGHTASDQRSWTGGRD
jgi:hypothetical protein